MTARAIFGPVTAKTGWMLKSVSDMPAAKQLVNRMMSRFRDGLRVVRLSSQRTKVLRRGVGWIEPAYRGLD